MGIVPGKWILLDFDGPVCSVFAGYPAPIIAKELIATGAANGASLTVPLNDPHEVLRLVYRIHPTAAREVERALQAAELAAVETAQPTVGLLELLEHWTTEGRHIGIVSNNHGPAVQRYLELHRLTPYVQHVEGRDENDVRLMKPNPHLLLSALEAMGASPSETAFVGDSVTDVEAALAAGIAPVGYANKPGKQHRLAAAGAVVVVTAMRELANRI